MKIVSREKGNKKLQNKQLASFDKKQTITVLQQQWTPKLRTMLNEESTKATGYVLTHSENQNTIK